MISMRIWVIVLLATGCGESNEEIRAKIEADFEARKKPSTVKKPLEIEWTKDGSSSKGTIKGGGKIDAGGFKGKYHITLAELPEYSKWTIGAQSGTIGRHYSLVDIEIVDKIANLTWKQLDAVDPDAELELALHDGRTGKVKLPPIGLAYAVSDMLKTVENAPVLFGKEPDDPKKQDSLYWPDGLGDTKMYGKAGKLYEIDWVLVHHKLPETKGTKNCGGYQSKGQPMPDITLELKEFEAVIYNRRSGEPVDKKVFAPDPECPMFTYQKAGDTKTDSYPPYSKIEAWVRTKVKR